MADTSADASPDERRFYLDDVERTIGRRWSLWMYDHPGARLAHGVVGALLFGLSAYQIAEKGLAVELFVYTNAVLGLAFLAVAFHLRIGDYLFGRTATRPFLSLRDDGIIARTRGREQTFSWHDLAVVREEAARLVLVPREGTPVTIPYSDLSYERVQDIRSQVVATAEAHGVRVARD